MPDDPNFLGETWPTKPVDPALEHAPGEKSKRWHRRQERLQRVRALSGIEHVRIVPANEKVRKGPGHPLAGKFPSHGSAEWPRDAFTQARLDDGDVTIEPGTRPRRRLVESSRPTPGATREVPQVRAARAASPPRPPRPAE